MDVDTISNNDNNLNNHNDSWNINDDASSNYVPWPDNYNTIETSTWDTPDDKTVVASPSNNYLDDSCNWTNNDFDDFFENSLERFKNDLLRVFTDFYYEWQECPSSERSSTSYDNQKQIVNVNEIDGELVIHVELPGFRMENINGRIIDYSRYFGTIVFPYNIDTGKSQLFFDQSTLEIKVFRAEYVHESLNDWKLFNNDFEKFLNAISMLDSGDRKIRDQVISEPYRPKLN
ncbi:2061_t:CDS:2, partial [Scutellospora calospora]